MGFGWCVSGIPGGRGIRNRFCMPLLLVSAPAVSRVASTNRVRLTALCGLLFLCSVCGFGLQQQLPIHQNHTFRLRIQPIKAEFAMWLFRLPYIVLSLLMVLARGVPQSGGCTAVTLVCRLQVLPTVGMSAMLCGIAAYSHKSHNSFRLSSVVCRVVFIQACIVVGHNLPPLGLCQWVAAFSNVTLQSRALRQWCMSNLTWPLAMRCWMVVSAAPVCARRVWHLCAYR